MKLTSTFLAVAAVAAVLAASAFAATGAASAQEPTPTPAATIAQHQSLGQHFLEKLAGNLGISLDQLKQAIKTTELQIVDEMAADGKLTADQAQTLKDKINSGQGLGLGRFLGAYRRGRLDGARLQRLKAGIVRSAATAIGVQPRDLVQELKAGKSIADVAAEHNVSLDTVKEQIATDVKSALDKAVQNNRITQAKADQLLQQLTARLDDILNKKKA